MYQAGQRHDPGEGGGPTWVPGAAPAGGVRPEGRVSMRCEDMQQETCRRSRHHFGKRISLEFLKIVVFV